MKYDPKDIERGHAAERLLNDTLFSEAVLEVEQQCIARWRTGKTTADRERAHAELVGLESIVRHIRTILQRGDVAVDIERRERAARTLNRRTTETE